MERRDFLRRILLSATAAPLAVVGFKAASAKLSEPSEELSAQVGKAATAHPEKAPLEDLKAPKEFSMKKIILTEEAWRERLTAEQFKILRRAGTERPFTSPLLEEKRVGQYSCAGCELPLFHSSAKYESGTGWPSFFQALEGRIATKEDRSLFMVRTEYHCARCEGHQGHVFEDGPAPTYLRYCNNGLALKFIPTA